VKVGELQTVGRKRVNVWGVDVRTEASHLRKAGVIKKHENDVWSVGAWVGWSRKPRL
jgi:hypothetical protein